jgi:hypothetical protein
MLKHEFCCVDGNEVANAIRERTLLVGNTCPITITNIIGIHVLCT